MVSQLTDTVEHAVAEAADHQFEKTTEAIDRQFQEIAGRTKGFQFTPSIQKKRVYRFVMG